MKRCPVFLFVVIVMVLGCSRLGRDIPCQTVTFTVGNISCGDMPDTKATVTEFLRTVKTYYQPTLTIESVTDRTFYVEVQVGESVDLPIGSYDVTATYRHSVIGVVGGHSLAEEPIYKINETVEIVPRQTVYYLTGIYQCWACVINYLDTQKYRLDGHEYNFVRDDIGEKGVLFVSTIEPGNSWTLIAYPQDDVNYDAATFTIGSNEAGKWYCYSPSLIEEQSGTFAVTLPDFEEAH